ncbi:MAG: hypothetical protein WC858_06075 [Parcubacteria group bacterium]|jgi:hypothetical protein
MPKKKKQKKQEAQKKENKITEKYHRTPEDIIFGFVAAFSLAFALLFYGASANFKADPAPQAKFRSAAKLEKNVNTLISNYPIKQMAPYIAKQDKKVAAFLLAIAKKESNWGKLSPKKFGQECYNYWGYRGQENTTNSGYSCFQSPAQAVKVVGSRIEDLIAQNVDTPREMVMWKCGSACTARGANGEAKWVKDVGYYYNKVYKL